MWTTQRLLTPSAHKRTHTQTHTHTHTYTHTHTTPAHTQRRHTHTYTYTQTTTNDEPLLNLIETRMNFLHRCIALCFLSECSNIHIPLGLHFPQTNRALGSAITHIQHTAFCMKFLANILHGLLELCCVYDCVCDCKHIDVFH